MWGPERIFVDPKSPIQGLNSKNLCRVAGKPIQEWQPKSSETVLLRLLEYLLTYMGVSVFMVVRGVCQ